MTAPAVSTIAQLLYQNDHTLDFARIVAELETVLSRLQGEEVQIDWDCDDLITFEFAQTRIVLSCTDFGRTGRETCLTVSCGPAGMAPGAGDHRVLCCRLVQRISTRFVPTQVVWSEASGPVNADLIDLLVEGLPAQPVRLPPVESILDKVVQSDRIKAKPRPKPHALHMFNLKAAAPEVKPTKAWDKPANDNPDLQRPRDAHLIRLREALYPPKTAVAAHSTPLRLTAQCFNATLILIYAPLGAAVMTYSILRGEDMRLSARLMAVTGTLFAVAQTPVGQVVKAMAGV